VFAYDNNCDVITIIHRTSDVSRDTVARGASRVYFWTDSGSTYQRRTRNYPFSTFRSRRISRNNIIVCFVRAKRYRDLGPESKRKKSVPVAGNL